jgi:predicted CxxxxCH...CXXCH cytochrome family protein
MSRRSPHLGRPGAALLCLMVMGCRVGGPDELPDAGSEAGDVPEPCSGCHGTAGLFAPPPGVDGETAVSAPPVGAHGPHLLPSYWHGPVACAECHRVPVTVEDEGHIDYPPAEVRWGPLATSGGTLPDWDGTSCAGTYCHGGTLSGGTVRVPEWTRVDGTQAACGACHGLPPSEPHPVATDCPLCHARRYADPQLHVNGFVEFL